ncbi:serine-threonine protein kinase [Nocardia crassostreae]|uniref:serine-threonine protein kinase n=1 Tax=Nocardia crassostreae TaxID=53428 RepID=UPI00082A2FA5|nr:serine-threonine protein kinase [Nocardia crassostreae]
MTDTIVGRPFWRLVFDDDGDAQPQQVATLSQEIRDSGVTDIVFFSHGWNNGEDTAVRLYKRWFELLAAHVGAARKVGFVGVFWPSQLWRDEPIPDVDSAPRHVGDGAAALDAGATVDAGAPTLDPLVLADLKSMFPKGSGQLDAIAGLLAAPPSRATLNDLFAQLRSFHEATPQGFGDGETEQGGDPGMLDATDHSPVELFEEFAAKLADTGVEFGSGGGEAGLGDFLDKALHGAKEALRQLSYWKMKNRAGVVGRTGLGPVVAKLGADHPGLRVHLVGHSFGARVVAYALDGLPDGSATVKSITLLQGAFSRFTFTDRLPFRDGSGALAGRLARLDGPLTVCHSSHDSALSTMYPLASLAAKDDARGADDRLFRFRAMGSHGAFDAERHPLGNPGTAYPFQPHRMLNLDASDVVNQGGPPSGAHSDIFKTQLAWVVAAAGGLT